MDGFSPNVQEVLDKFKFHNQIPTLIEADALGFLIAKFIDSSVNLSPKPVLHPDGSVRLPGLDNHSMGTIFEELIRRFNEENNEEAGEHFTPRDVVKLMAHLVLMPIADKTRSGTYLVYDGAWFVLDSVKTGYEISFTRYFYKPQPLRTLDEVRAYILALEKETEGLLGEIIGDSRGS